MPCCICNPGKDPMREIDLILLEDVMRRYPVEINATAKLFQIGGLVLVLLMVAGILVHDIVHHDPSATARAPATQTQQPAMMR
jgi:hypothetical protein